ncbi:GNAT family N-acetyltransferase [Solirubrobacter soli]|uniref:GNAT family N-acetyltransferase n=1 Tax=Solirubrobacter soli TaxID=363832 RepID=UPI0004276E99|nr:GNAT family N-acetyltransferase [Solirubrobacter soli]
MIRPVRAEEYPAALKVIGDAFSIVVRPPTVHTTVAEADDGHFLAVERDGAIVATGASVGFGPTGWIGGIAVAPEARGARLGQALTEAVIDALGPRETLLLLASDAGRPIYERLGFEVEERYVVMWGPESATPAANGLRRLTAADRDAVAALDARVTGEARSLVLDVGLDGAIATPDLSAVAFRPPWPALPIVASDPDAGATLLRALIAPGLRLAVPESNAAALETLRALGCTPGRDVVRMRSGAPVQWRPDELWGVFSLFFG